MPGKKEQHLSVKEVARLLDVPLITVQRWIHQGKIPSRLSGSQVYFRRTEVLEWASSHQLGVDRQPAVETGASVVKSWTLKECVQRAGCFYDLPGNDIYAVLQAAVERLPFLGSLDKGMVLDALTEREEIASTGIGRGVAIPHPRKPLPLKLDSPRVPVFWLKEAGIEYNSVDGKPVSVLFFIFSPSTQDHLKILARLSYCLRDSQFLKLIKSTPDLAGVLGAIERIEEKFASGE